MQERDSKYKQICFNKCFYNNLSNTSIEQFVIEQNEWLSWKLVAGKLRYQTSNPKNPDSLDVMKIQTRKTQNLWLSWKLGPKK